jgi:hypothetical protein
MIVLTDKQATVLDSYIKELPTKFGYAFVELFKSFAEENEKAKQESKTKVAEFNESVKPSVEVEAE